MSQRERDERDPKRPTAKATKKAPVIELNQNHGLTPGEAFVRRLLPAAVISAGFHLLVAVGAFVLTLLVPTPEATAVAKRVDVAVEEQTETPQDANLTEQNVTIDDPGSAVTVEHVPPADTSLQGEVNPNEAVGDPTGTVNEKIDSLKLFGSMNDNSAMPGIDTLAPGAGIAGAGSQGLGVSNPLTTGRNAGTRQVLLQTGGGNTESEAAVARGLAWLARVQKKDGTWVYDAGGEIAASTGMGVLPFLAAGQTHKPGKDNKYRENVTAAIAALLKMQKSDGSFSTNTYANAIAVVALCEAFGMTGDKALLLRPCQTAIDLIQKGQGANGSWGYKYGDQGDTSIVGWQIQALHSAKMCKELKVDSKVLQKAMKFLDTVASKPPKVNDKDGKPAFAGATTQSAFGYSSPTPANPSESLTAVGLLCRYYLNGWGPNSPGFRDGTDYILAKHPPENEQKFDIYYYYYATQVLHYRSGDEWHKRWNPKMRDMLITKQVKDAGKPGVDGSWDKDTTHIGDSCGRMGTTAMALLTLEVYYRHLPLYGRGTGALNEVDR